MPKPGLRKIKQYSSEFKVTAVKLSSIKGVQIQDVAEELDIHPFMLSRWRKEYREGKIMARVGDVKIDPKTAAELKRLRKLERDHNRLRMEQSVQSTIRPCCPVFVQGTRDGSEQVSQEKT